MAAGCTIADISHKCTKESICSDNTYLNIVCDDKRVTWLDNSEQLKEFVGSNLKESGKWILPRGQSRHIQSINSDLCFTWYFGKQKT